jgi:hypothetical protein
MGRDWKKGDKIKRVAGSDIEGIILGNIYTLRELKGDYLYVEELNDSFETQNFELFNETPNKQLSKVTIIREGDVTEITIKAELTVDQVAAILKLADPL